MNSMNGKSLLVKTNLSRKACISGYGASRINPFRTILFLILLLFHLKVVCQQSLHKCKIIKFGTYDTAESILKYILCGKRIEFSEEIALTNITMIKSGFYLIEVNIISIGWNVVSRNMKCLYDFHIFFIRILCILVTNDILQ